MRILVGHRHRLNMYSTLKTKSDYYIFIFFYIYKRFYIIYSYTHYLHIYI